MRVGMTKLASALGGYVGCAEEGETVVITRRGRPVAKLVPLHAEPKAAHGPAVERRIVNAAIEWHGGRHLSAISPERGGQTLALSYAVEDLLRPPTCGCCGTSPCTCPTLDGGA